MNQDHQQLLDQLRERHHVPGATFGVVQLGQTEAADRIDSYASGLLNLDTEVPATTDSVFQIGSISKTFTATMIMRLVERGQLELGQPVRGILPEFRSAGESFDLEITVRHLLSHSSGIDGDVFTDYGRGDDAVMRYVDGLVDVPQLFRPGSMFSYCNAGFVVLGRMIEHLTGTSWDRAVADLIFAPLSLNTAGTLAEQAILHRAAVGHDGAPGGPRSVIRRWQLPRAVGPAGLIHAGVDDLLRYAQLHLRDGRLAGRTLLDPELVTVMRSRQIDTPPGVQLDGWQGLGWQVDHVDGHEVYGHNGATVGQYAYLLIIPDAGLALALLTNGPGAGLMWAELRQAILAEHKINIPIAFAEPPSEPHPLDATPAVLGEYARTGERYQVTGTDTGLQVHVVPTDESPDPEDEPETMPLIPITDDHFVGRTDERLAWTNFNHGTFTDAQHPDGGDYLYTGTRVTPRVS